MGALLGGAAEEPVVAAAVRRVRALDLASRERSLRGRLPGLEHVLERFARGLRAALGGLVGLPPEVRVEAVELVRFGTCTARLAGPLVVRRFNLAPLRGQGLLALAPELLDAAVEARLGGTAARRATRPRRDLSPVEQRVLERLAGRVLEELRAAWSPLGPAAFALLDGAGAPALASVARPEELTLVVELRVALAGGGDARLGLAVPDAALDPVRRRLESAADGGGAAPAAWGERLRAALAEAELEVAAELGRHGLRLRDVLRLRVGDVIPLGTGGPAPIVVRVEGRPCFRAAPETARSPGAVRVTGRL